LALVSPAPLWFTASDYPFGIFKLGPCITCLWFSASDYPIWYLQTFGPCITCPSLIYTFSLPHLVSSNFLPLYHLSLSDLHLLITPFGIFKLLSLVSLVPLWFTPSHYSFGIFKLLALVSPVPLWFTPSHYPFGIFKLLAHVSPVPLWFTPSDYPFWNFNLSNFWPLNHLSLSDLHLLITLLVSSNFWPLYRLSLSDLRLLITLLVSFKLLALVSSVPLWFTPSHYPFWNFNLSSFWPLNHLSLSDLHLLITPLESSNFWPLYQLSLSDLQLLITLLVSSNFWLLYHLSLSDLHLLVTLLESSNFWPLNHLSLSDLHLLINPFGILIFQTFGPYLTCPSLNYTLSLPLWYLQTFLNRSLIFYLLQNVASLFSQF
jgi:hypothetical protein